MSLKSIQTNKVLNDVEVTKNTSSASYPTAGIDMDLNNVQGSFGAQVVITGDGTATLGFECSNDGTNWIKPSASAAANTALTIATGLTKTGGPGSNGKYFFPITNIPACKLIRFYGSETANSANVTINMTLSFQ